MERQWEVVKKALATHKMLHRNMTVRRSFLVPSSEEWPEEAWGMALGATVNQIRSANYFVDGNPERRQWLDDEGFVWALRAGTSERAREAAVRYERRRAGASTAVGPH
jgi:hypothetical protein